MIEKYQALLLRKKGRLVTIDKARVSGATNGDDTVGIIYG